MASRQARTRVDWVDWTLYRRAFAFAALALVAVLATSFHPAAIEPQQSPNFDGDAVQGLTALEQQFAKQFPSRAPGSATELNAAQWVAAKFTAANLHTRLVPGTARVPRGSSIGIANVEAVLPGRDPQTVVIVAPRDTDSASDTSSATDTAALVTIAQQLALSQDRRRTYLFVSTDASTDGAGGARLLAADLQARHTPVFAIVGLEDIGGDGTLRVPLIAAGDNVSSLGLTNVAQAAVEGEGGSGAPPALTSQLLRLGLPVSLLQQAQYQRAGFAATTITARPEREIGQTDSSNAADTARVTSGVRAVLRVTNILEGLDTLQSAGKTYIATSQRVYRGWALKLLLASLLLPVWIGAISVLLRGRALWNLAAAAGSTARAALAGLWSLIALWLVGACGLLPAAGDLPPNPHSLGHAPVVGLAAWIVLTCAGWIVARGPDWRYRASGRDGADATHAVLAVGVTALSLLAIPVLAIDPYAVLELLVPLHVWLLLSSRFGVERRARLAIWALGTLPVVIVVAWLTREFGLGLAGPWYVVELARTRSIQPSLLLVESLGAGVAMLLLVASANRLCSPVLHRLQVRRTGHAGFATEASTAVREAADGLLGLVAAVRTRRAHTSRSSQPAPRTMTAAQRAELRIARRSEQHASRDGRAARSRSNSR